MNEPLSFESPGKACEKCAGVMENGFIADYTYGDSDSTIVQNIWIEGDLERSWARTKTKGKRKYLIETFRCTNCGYLESFAVKEKK